MNSPAPSRKLFQATVLSGLSHSRYKEFQDKFQPGVPLILRADPDNKFDQFAVAIDLETEDGPVHIGWIPKGSNMEISAALQNDIPLTCEVASHRMLLPVTQRLYVNIYLPVSE